MRFEWHGFKGPATETESYRIDGKWVGLMKNGYRPDHCRLSHAELLNAGDGVFLRILHALDKDGEIHVVSWWDGMNDPYMKVDHRELAFPLKDK